MCLSLPLSERLMHASLRHKKRTNINFREFTLSATFCRNRNYPGQVVDGRFRRSCEQRVFRPFAGDKYIYFDSDNRSYYVRFVGNRSENRQLVRREVQVQSGNRGGDISYPYGSENSSAIFGRNKFLTEIKYNFCCKEYILYVRISPRETSR